MTEKTRFIYKDNRMWFSFIDRQTGKHLNAIMCCNLMNELHEENIRLKKERNHFERKKTEYLTEWNNCRIQNTELKKDNQELKEAMKRLMTDLMTKRGV